jgi:hypothetical protein
MDICRRYSANSTPPDNHDNLGISDSALRGELPLNGLRHPPESGTCGWFIWAGEELSTEADFFKPMHVEHISERCPAALPYLPLPPGWRFLIANGYEDVWYDEALLSPSA